MSGNSRDVGELSPCTASGLSGRASAPPGSVTLPPTLALNGPMSARACSSSSSMPPAASTAGSPPHRSPTVNATLTYTRPRSSPLILRTSYCELRTAPNYRRQPLSSFVPRLAADRSGERSRAWLSDARCSGCGCRPCLRHRSRCARRATRWPGSSRRRPPRSSRPRARRRQRRPGRPAAHPHRLGPGPAPARRRAVQREVQRLQDAALTRRGASSTSPAPTSGAPATRSSAPCCSSRTAAPATTRCATR